MEAIACFPPGKAIAAALAASLFSMYEVLHGLSMVGLEWMLENAHRPHVQMPTPNRYPINIISHFDSLSSLDRNNTSAIWGSTMSSTQRCLPNHACTPTPVLRAPGKPQP